MDLAAAIKEGGLQFCRATNGVVLSEGPIPVRYLRRIKVSAGVTCAGGSRSAGGWVPVAGGRAPQCCVMPNLLPGRYCHTPLQLRDLPEGWQKEMPNRERLLQEEAA